MTTATHLRDRVMHGDLIHRTVNGVNYSLWKQAGEFVMVKQGGGANPPHQLLVEATNAQRLQAHWDGFCGVERAPDPIIPMPAAAPASAPRKVIPQREFRDEKGRVVYVPVKHERIIRWAPGAGCGKLWSNQQWRDADLLGTGDGIALIEYEMPNGRTYLIEIGWDMEQERPTEVVAYEHFDHEWSPDLKEYRPVSYTIKHQLAHMRNISRRAIPKRWQSLFPQPHTCPPPEKSGPVFLESHNTCP